jgi:ferrous iron transport protein B
MAANVTGVDADIGKAEPGPRGTGRRVRVALLGNPNTGKTTLFNRLSGLRHKTSNFPGTTLEARLGRVWLEAKSGAPRSAPCCGSESVEEAWHGDMEGEFLELIDLPGVYSLELDQLESRIARDVVEGTLAPKGCDKRLPETICVVADATNLVRNLMLAGEALRRRLPTVVAVNMIDIARRQGLSIDAAELSKALGCRVVLISARTGEGLDELRAEISEGTIPTRTPPGDAAGLRKWAEDAFALAGELSGVDTGHDSFTDRLDRVFTHPVAGAAVFVAVMIGLFWTIFALAQFPMAGIEFVFGQIGGFVQNSVPDGILQDFLANGVVAGLSGTVVFLPQICLLFFLISLLEDTGYLARAAFVMDRVLRPFGLPGHSFVPLLSSHACALPGIMATRAIPDPRERLATILVAPFMTCSARLPVYVLVTSILFATKPLMASLAFVGCYALGITAGIISAVIARRTVLRGKSRPMALELPTYKLPSLRTAGITTIDRGWVFLKKAGTTIMLISMVLWWLGSYPKVNPPASAVELRQRAAAMHEQASQSADATAPDEQALLDEAAGLERRDAKARSFMGMAARTAAPIFRPLGYDWQLTVGILTSFAAREAFVGTMAVVLAEAEDDSGAIEDQGVMDRIRKAKRDDGVTPVFTRATCWSVLVFFVLAMQCLPTLAVTAKESGHWKWALLQFAWMSAVAYAAAAITYAVAAGLGGAGA